MTIDVAGKTYVAVWDHPGAVRRSKLANPALLVYVPAVLDLQWVQQRISSPSFFLIDSRDPNLQTGREISQAELIGLSELAQAA
ncbi:MAG: hypothetical protein RMM98_00335 [Acidobacteriota bacterium]|nr:hypothetical protein [Blastocatellia bacterium]MDW8238035.1 hypothetical protein [Acidobacteriota bacterium]